MMCLNVEACPLLVAIDFERSAIFDAEYSILIDWCLQILPRIGHLVYLCSDEV